MPLSLIKVEALFSMGMPGDLCGLSRLDGFVTVQLVSYYMKMLVLCQPIMLKLGREGNEF